MTRGLAILRRVLDGLYLAGGVLGALFLIAILVLIVAQMVARWTSTTLPGVAEYAGYCMAASSFFALAYALNKGAHIRVSLLLTALGRHRRIGEIWCYAIGAITAVFFTWYAIDATWLSYKINDISQSQDATPLWIPQLSMALGALLLSLALVDHLVRIVFTGHLGAERAGLEDQSHAE